MAIFVCRVQTISRRAQVGRDGKERPGRSAVAAAAYRSGEKITDERATAAAGQLVVHDYRRKRDIEHKSILTPTGVTPPSREALWNAAEAAERRKDATVAREALVAVPHELNPMQRRAVATEFGRWIANRYHVAVDVCLHKPHAEKRYRKNQQPNIYDPDPRNYQAHIMFTTRMINADGDLTKKTRILDEKQTGRPEIERIRKQWEIICNKHLELAGISERIDCRSLKDQGIDRAPQVHLGPAHAALLRRGAADKNGVAQMRADYNKAIKQQTPPATERAERADEPRTSAASYQVKPPAAPKRDLTGPGADYYERKKARLAAQAAQEEAARRLAAEAAAAAARQEQEKEQKDNNIQGDQAIGLKGRRPETVMERRQREHSAAMEKAGVYIKKTAREEEHVR